MTPAGRGRPTAAKLAVRYSKRGRLRFASARDLQRVFERALRRAGVPMAYSQGFTAHPKISYLGAAPTGCASEAEYLEVGLADAVTPQRFAQQLGAELPAGLTVERVEESASGLAGKLEASDWEIVLPQADADEVAAAVRDFDACPEVTVEKVRGTTKRVVDVRAPVCLLRPVVPGMERSELGRAARTAGSKCAILHLVVRHTTPAVRPDDVVTALRLAGGLSIPLPPVATRMAQGPLGPNALGVADPLG